MCQTAEPAKADSQGVKDRWATSDLHGDPANCELADTIPGRTDALSSRSGCHSAGPRMMPRLARSWALWRPKAGAVSGHDDLHRSGAAARLGPAGNRRPE